MSILADMLHKRFWLGVLLTMATAAAVCAVAAWIVVCGILPPQRASVGVYAACFLAALVGGVRASAGKSRALLRGLLNAVAALALLWLVGLTAAGPGGGPSHLISSAASAATGVLAAVLLRPSGRGGKNRKVAKKR